MLYYPSYRYIAKEMIKEYHCFFIMKIIVLLVCFIEQPTGMWCVYIKKIIKALGVSVTQSKSQLELR